LFFGYLTDRFGRKKLFIITLILSGSTPAGSSPGPASAGSTRPPTSAGGSPLPWAPSSAWASCWCGATSPRGPRWLFIHGRNEQAEELVDEVERQVEEETGEPLEEVADSIKIRQRKSIGFGVEDDIVPAYIIPFAFGNLLGPLLLGRCRPRPWPPAGWWCSSSPRPGPAPPT